MSAVIRRILVAAAGDHPASALRASVTRLEGQNVYTEASGHGRPPRLEECFGTLKNVRLEQCGITADLHYPASHRLAGQIAEDISRNLKMFGVRPLQLDRAHPRVELGCKGEYCGPLLAPRFEQSPVDGEINLREHWAPTRSNDLRSFWK